MKAQFKGNNDHFAASVKTTVHNNRKRNGRKCAQHALECLQFQPRKIIFGQMALTQTQLWPLLFCNVFNLKLN